MGYFRQISKKWNNFDSQNDKKERKFWVDFWNFKKNVFSKFSKTTDLIELNKIKQSDHPLTKNVPFWKQECTKRRHTFSAAVSIFIGAFEND